MLNLDLQRSNDNLAVHGKIIIHLSTNVTTPLSNPGPSQTSGLATALGNLASNASTASLTPSQGPIGTAAQSAAASTTTMAATSASVSDTSVPDLPRRGSTRANAVTDPNSNPNAAASDRNFSATEDQYGPLPTGWERRTDHLGRTYYVSTHQQTARTLLTESYQVDHNRCGCFKHEST
jgi:E3 ubiquitin-protein ligase NEDD4